MPTVIEIVGALACLVVLPGTIELALLSLASILPRRRERSQGPLGRTPRLAVVIPAHDEEGTIERCLSNLLADDPYIDVFVVADNCEDDTATIAAIQGARVLVRRDPDRRGKGYALDFAFRRLLEEGFEAFVVVDADSVVDADFLPTCRRLFAAGADAVQARYGVLNPEDSLRTRLMHVAFLAFNILRPRGRDRLGLSAGLFGNGFGLSAETLRAVPFDATSVVEDLEYHLRLVRAGRRVRFADETWVRAEMPAAGAGVGTQRARWEGGRLRMLADKAPGLLKDICSGRLRLIEPLFDLLLLPLAFHVLLLALASVLLSGTNYVWLPLAGLGITASHVVFSLFLGKASLRDASALGAAPFYVLWKLLVAPRILNASRREAAWVRTQRRSGTED